MLKNYEMVIGLEVHVELKTQTKIFCNCPTAFGAAPNTQCCPVCMGMPGTLPVLNRQVVEYAARAGLATHCTIASYSKQDRKNYFYPDLPKAYQISQYDVPLCEQGYLDIGTKRIGITRIHIEEDAGKLIHDEKNGTQIDCNRCGVPLIEIVSEPDIRSAEEAKAYLQKLRAVILYTEISDCKMNEGSFRCDVNLSIRKIGETTLGTRTEMKNLNSFQFIQKAIEQEYQRQVDALEAGETILQETRRFDQTTGKTDSMRKKEDANDYRYFPDPDLPPIVLSEETIATWKKKLPLLPDDRKAVYMQTYDLSVYDSETLIRDKCISDYFERAVKHTNYPKLLANLITGEWFRFLPPDIAETNLTIAPEHFATLADLLGENRINSSTAKKLVKALTERDCDPIVLVQEQGLEQINDDALLTTYIEEVFTATPKLLTDYKNGKTSVLQSVVGRVMAKSNGRANPVIVHEILEKFLYNK